MRSLAMKTYVFLWLLVAKTYMRDAFVDNSAARFVMDLSKYRVRAKIFIRLGSDTMLKFFTLAGLMM